jgi:hypothetical protein
MLASPCVGASRAGGSLRGASATCALQPRLVPRRQAAAGTPGVWGRTATEVGGAVRGGAGSPHVMAGTRGASAPAPQRRLRCQGRAMQRREQAAGMSTWGPPGAAGEARRRTCSSALLRRRGAGTSPGSPAARGGSPATARYQPAARTGSRAAAQTGAQFRPLVRKPVVAGHRGGIASAVCAMAQPWTTVAWAVRPAPPHDPAASAPCLLLCCLRRSLVALRHRSSASDGCRPPRFAADGPWAHGRAVHGRGPERLRRRGARQHWRWRQRVVHTRWGKGCARAGERLWIRGLRQPACWGSSGRTRARGRSARARRESTGVPWRGTIGSVAG